VAGIFCHKSQRFVVIGGDLGGYEWNAERWWIWPMMGEALFS